MAGVLKQAAHAPFLELGSSVVSSAHILVLDIEVEEAVEPSLALSRTGDSMVALRCFVICPLVFKVTPLICSWRCPIRLWVLPRETL